jgi:hypothetical protein
VRGLPGGGRGGWCEEPQRCVKKLTKVKKVPGQLEQLANFPSKTTQVSGGKREVAGAPSTVNAPGTRVCVRAQKCLCPGPPGKQGTFRGCTCPRGVRTFMREQPVTPGTGRSEYIDQPAEAVS